MKLSPYYRVPPKDWLLTANADISAAQRRAMAEPAKNEIEIEEYVRQWLLRELITSYGYPKDWLGEKIVVEETVQVATAEKQADISIKNDRGRTYIYLETKNAGVSDADFLKAERQLETYLSSTHTATIGCLTNGTVTKFTRKKVNPNDFDYIADIPEYGAGDKARVRLARDLNFVRNNGGKVGLQPLPPRYQNILFEAHSAIRDIDGLHDDNALDELCKIVYAKIFDERSVSQSSPDKEVEF